jgi:hypothetical protein
MFYSISRRKPTVLAVTRIRRFLVARQTPSGDVRELTDGFNGGFASRNKAADACTSVVELWKRGKKASKPRFAAPHVVYDLQTRFI